MIGSGAVIGREANAGTAVSLMIPPSSVMLRQNDVTGGQCLESPPHDCPAVDLDHKELWEEFARLGTEMVITKSGRFVHYTALVYYSNRCCIALR